jgi:hypothetical protein
MLQEKFVVGMKVRLVYVSEQDRGVGVAEGMTGEVYEAEEDTFVNVSLDDFSNGHGPSNKNRWFWSHQIEPMEDA